MSWRATAATTMIALALAAGCSSTTSRPAPTATPSSAGGSAAGSSTAGGPAPSPAVGGVVAGLALVPAGTSQFTITDLAAARKRWGLGDLTSAGGTDSAAFKTYLAKSKGSAAVGNIGIYTVPMMQDWGWSSLDVQWELAIQSKTGPPISVLRLRDDLDMSVVVKILDTHYHRSGPDTRPVYGMDLQKIGTATPFFAATAVPHQHLVVTGADPAAVLALVDGGSGSIGSDLVVSRLIAAVGPGDVVTVRSGADGCTDALGTAARASAAIIDRERKELGVYQLASPDGVAIALPDDVTAVVAVDYPDAATATAEVAKRTRLLSEGQSLATQQPYSDLMAVNSVVADGPVLAYHLTPSGSNARILAMTRNRDDPWAFCGVAPA